MNCCSFFFFFALLLFVLCLSLSLLHTHSHSHTIPYVRMYNSYVWFNSINFSFTILCWGFFLPLLLPLLVVLLLPLHLLSSLTACATALSCSLSRSLSRLRRSLAPKWGGRQRSSSLVSCTPSLSLSLSPSALRVPLGFYSIHVLCFFFCFVVFCLLLFFFSVHNFFLNVKCFLVCRRSIWAA